jgi:predicted dehydrogenase
MADKVRYAVVGMGYFAQNAVLPAFKHAPNSELTALVSGDPDKLQQLGRKYKVHHVLGYEQLDNFLASGGVDVVYLAVPNSLHKDFTLRAAKAGVHVLVEKPMALTAPDCEEMIQACDRAKVKLMVGYRLHFEPANLEAVEVVTSGEIGEARLFTSTFSYQVKEGNIRTRGDLGGGPLYDLGVYCINAARYLFREEPVEVVGFMGSGEDPRFADVEEVVSAILRFPGERIAQFAVSFGVGDTTRYEIVGTKGKLVLDPAYEYTEKLERQLTVKGKTTSKSYPKHDQVAAELQYFSRCVLDGSTPEPSGIEGLADVRIVNAIQRSAETRQVVALGGFEKRGRPEPGQEIKKPGLDKQDLVETEPPTRD